MVEGSRLQKKYKMTKKDKGSGLVELIAPFGGVDALLEDLKAGALKGRKVRLHRIDAEGIKAGSI